MYRHFGVVVGITLWWWWWSSLVTNGDGNVVRNEDICGLQNGRRLYLELGEKGILYAKNVSFVKNEPRQDGSSRVYTSNSSHAQCSLELVTCPSCVIIINFQSIALSHHCGDVSVTLDSPCRCDYVWISEPPYEDVSGSPFCGLYAPITYRSSTRTLSITLLYSQPHKHAFTLEYTAERNRLHLRGIELTATGQAAKGLNSTGGGILTSPFFPARYPRDLGLEYVITCPAEAPSCRIRLLFSDFQLATVSIMEFYDWNGQRLDVSSGARFRPPVILSSGPSLLIRFYANGGTGLGYKAFYSFVIGHPLDDKSVQPITDCGGYVENLGGAITMVDMVGEGIKTYDCVWLIRPPKNFLHMKTHMYLKVVTFTDMAGNTELIVRQGPTSALLPLEILRHPASQVQPPRHREHVAPVTSGFHVSLRGTFGPASHLAIAYAAFSYMDCFAGSDFLCRNHRCIPSQLNCDGFDHCGDNSDEPATCFRDWEVEPQERKWHVNKANYYFPKIDRYPDLKTATLVFVASSLGLIVLISALIVLLYRMGARARQQRELQSRLQTISELLVFDITDGARIDEISVSDDPPMYEAPPGYEEVVKLGHDSEIVARKKKGFGRESLNRSSPGHSCSLEVDRPSFCPISDTASTSRGNCHMATTSVRNSVRTRKCITSLPDSPPPPYITPPGSMLRNFPPLEAVALWTEQREDNRQTEEPVAAGTEMQEKTKDNEEENDGAFLGAYPWNCDGSSSIRSADTSCNSQRMISRDALLDTSLGRDERKGEQKETVEDEQRSGETAKGGNLADLVENNGKSEVASATVCSCEGACGCATVHRAVALFKERPLGRLWPIRRMSADLDERVTKETMRQRQWQLEKDKGREEVKGQNDEEKTGAADEQDHEEHEEEEEEANEKENENENENENEDSCRSRSTIVRLLTARAGKWQNGSGTSTVTSTATSTPCSTFRRSMRTLSACSRDAYLGRTVAVGSIGSYEKLSNSEFEVARSSSLHASDPACIGSHCQTQPRSCRRYSSCDLESFYEGIRILDGFLARRGVAKSGKQSVTVMLFGTPEHEAVRRRPTGGDERIREIARVSHFSLDPMST